ncbi:MAG TPA: right-handed parallel beta-helix repeat-containing protein [Lacipirellulaceae bacterium]|nr:right-handed parallel beta-helix repeat-containing protein [Lacipirellulaceae bacterium]
MSAGQIGLADSDERKADETAHQCHILSLTDLDRCFSELSPYDVISIDADLTCASALECCPTSRRALFEINQNNKSKIIQGNGHVLHRLGGLDECAAVRLADVKDVQIRGLSFDEGETIPPCTLADTRCPSVVDVQFAENVTLANVKTYFGKGYAIRVWNSSDFTLEDSIISDSGMIGVYIGNYKYGVSKNVVIRSNVIARSRANAIAIQGAVSRDPDHPVLIEGNILTGNHWHGLWPVPGVQGGITSGGQLLLADGVNIRVTGNIIADGRCENCRPVGQTVAAIEIADQGPPPAGVAGLVIDHNDFLDGEGAAVRQNPGTEVSDITMSDNRVVGFRVLDTVVSPAIRAFNRIEADGSHVPNEIVSYQRMGRYYIGRRPDKLRSDKEAVFYLSAAPRPGASGIPLLQCGQSAYPNGRSASALMACQGLEQVKAVLGYVFERSYPSGRPFFKCRANGSQLEYFLSWDSTCRGYEVISQLGYALPAVAGRSHN